MYKDFVKKTVLLILSATIAAGMSTNVLAADKTDKNEYVTREYAVSEFVQSVGRNNLKGNTNILKNFKDFDDIDEEYKADFASAASNGVINGYDDFTLKPKEQISRVEALTILARCMEDAPSADDTEEGGEPLEFTDVPEWAKQYIDTLSAAGIVEGYGDGKLGTDDMLTAEQLKLLTDRTDNLYNTTDVGESFYGYTNNKKFRNVSVESINEVDAKHGAIISTTDSWSAFGDIAKKVSDEEDTVLRKLMDGELKYENGSVEQRIHDMLLAIDKGESMTEDDLALYDEMKTKIIKAKNIEELINVSYDICNDVGINPLFNLSGDMDEETNIVKPSISLASAGIGGIIAYKSSVKKNLSAPYKKIITDYAKACGLNVSDADITKAIELQEETSRDTDYFQQYLMGLQFKQMFDDTFSDEDREREIQTLLKEHPDVDAETYTSTKVTKKTYSLDELSNRFKTIDVADIFKKTGFNGIDSIIVDYDDVMNDTDKLLDSSNLNGWKVNALIKLGMDLNASSNKEEETELCNLNNLYVVALLDMELDEDEADDVDQSQAAEEIQDMMDEDENDILNSKNIMLLRNSLPNDIGLLYAKYYYDDETTATLQKMVTDIKNAYIKRFENNIWMSEETKQNAIKKVNEIISIIGYKNDLVSPVILSPENGGTYFNNIGRIKRSELNAYIEMAKDPEAIRNMPLAPADTVNAFYAPSFNNITILAGIINMPIYDKNRSYAANLGAIGMVVGHEIGHAFDNNGSQYDGTGRKVNWWTDEDTAKYQEKIDEFKEYYKNFDIADGVVQDTELTIGENMADFASMQCVMDILAGDKEAQKEALESYASIWARLGTIEYITDSIFLNDVHSSNNVRVDAVVASLDEFYDLYDVKEGDAMYIAPENRLDLW